MVENLVVDLYHILGSGFELACVRYTPYGNDVCKEEGQCLTVTECSLLLVQGNEQCLTWGYCIC